MLNTALQLKDAIDKIPENFEPMGSISQSTKVYMIEHENHAEYLDEMESSSDDGDDPTIVEWLYNARNSYENEFNPFHDGKDDFDGNLTITTNNFSYSGNYKNFNQLEELFQVSPPAAFGNQNTLETVVDENVRNARDVTDFTIDQKIIGKICEIWSKHFYPKNVKVVPYKINIYEPDGKFDEHTDTPDVNLVGTFLLGLSEKSCYKSLKVTTDQNGNYDYWHRSDIGSWCAFYPDLPHSVQNKTRYHRGTIAFKIFSLDETKREIEFLNHNQYTGSLPTDLIGVVLSHDYSLNTDSFKGVDNLWYELINTLNPKSIRVVPILIQTSFSHWGYESSSEQPEGTMKVYLCDDNVIKYLSDKLDQTNLEQTNPDQTKPETPKDIQFVKMSRNGYEWKHNFEDFVEHTGNESRPEEEDSVYLHRALIVKF